MRALSVRQPWAWAILYAGKDIENRSWRNQHTIGTIAIHASAGRDDLDELPPGVRKPKPDQLVQGAIIGLVDVVDVVERHRSRWFRGPLGWVLKNPRPLSKPVPCKGALGLWEVSPAQKRAIQRQLGGEAAEVSARKAKTRKPRERDADEEDSADLEVPAEVMEEFEQALEEEAKTYLAALVAAYHQKGKAPAVRGQQARRLPIRTRRPPSRNRG